MSPTGRTLGIVVAWAFFGLLASVWPAFAPIDGGSPLSTLTPLMVPAWWISGAVIVAVAVVDAIVLFRLEKLQIARRLPGRFAVGEASEVRLDLFNPGRLPAVVEVFDGVPAGAEAEAMPWSGSITPGGKAKLTHPVRIIERGLAHFGPVHIRRTSALALWRRKYLTGEAEDVRVYPDYEPVLRFALLSLQHRPDQMGIVRKSFAGSSRDFHQLREYREGDPLSQIDWKATS